MEIVRVVDVNSLLLPKAVLIETGWTPRFVADALASMPCGEGVKRRMKFFQSKRTSLSFTDLLEECDEHKVVLDPYGQAAVNRDDPMFAKEHPNISQWIGKDGRPCFMTFDFVGKIGSVLVNYSHGELSYPWWVAGVSKA